MFDVNLISPARGPRGVKASLLIAGAVAASLVLVSLAAWTYILGAHVNGLRHEVTLAAQDIDTLRPAARHAQDLGRTAERLRLRRDLVRQLLAAQIPASRVLRTIQSVIPRDVSLTSMTVKASDVTVEGYTSSYPSLARLMVQLEDSGIIRHVDLSSSQRGTVSDNDVVEFRMSGELMGVPAADSQKDAAP